MNKELLDSIRAANVEFRNFAKLIARTGGEAGGVQRVYRNLSKVHLRLKHISKCLAANRIASFESPEDAKEIQAYRANLQALRDTVEILQEKLLAEKMRINNVRSNVQAARAWAECIRTYS
jgi:hypothetical protein